MKNIDSDLVFDLINAFRSIKSNKDSVLFLQDILTAHEIKNLAVRLRIAKLLLKNVSQRDISIRLHISTATVTKVNSWLNQKGDGFREVITRLPIKFNKPIKPIKGPIEFHLPEILAAGAQYGIASVQNKLPDELIKNVENKKLSDRYLKQASEDYYKNKRRK
jgi:TrpR-related protein YerC/YecD